MSINSKASKASPSSTISDQRAPLSPAGERRDSESDANSASAASAAAAAAAAAAASPAPMQQQQQQQMSKPKRRKQQVAPTAQMTVEPGAMSADEGELVRAMELQPTINLGTLGHVAHGKSTLTRALSTVNTAKFREEEKRNMTIQLGYANVKVFRCTNAACRPPGCFSAGPSSQVVPPRCAQAQCGAPTRLERHISMVDCPGHHDFMSTMLSGAAVMDHALLLVAASEPCPCPQTAEHLAAAQLAGIGTRLAVVQNKLDLCSRERALESKAEIDTFMGEAGLERVPVIPISAQCGINIDAVCAYLASLPQPLRDLASPLRMTVVRTFDVNKPGTPADKVRGGVVGGTISRGSLAVGQTVELRPGVVFRDGSFRPLRCRILSLFSERNALQRAVPGGLIGVGLDIDPSLTKGNRLVGQAVGAVGSLPSVFRECRVDYRLLKRLLSPEEGAFDEDEWRKLPQLAAPASEDGKGEDDDQYSVAADSASERPRNMVAVAPIRRGERLRLCIGAARVEGLVMARQGGNERGAGGKNGPRKTRGVGVVQMQLERLVCADVGAAVALFRSTDGRRWQLIGSGTIASVIELPVPPAEVVPRTAAALAEDDEDGEDEESNDVAGEEDERGHDGVEQKTAKQRATAEPAPALQDHGVKGASTAASAVSAAAVAAAVAAVSSDESLTQTEQGVDDDDPALRSQRCRFYPRAMPEVGELVVTRVQRCDPLVGAYVELPEYAGATGLIGVSELTKRRCRNLRNAAFVGQQEVAVVLRVDPVRGFIDLSRKRVEGAERESHLSWFMRSGIFDGILRRAASLSRCDVQWLYARVGWPLYERAAEQSERACDDAPAHPLEFFHACSAVEEDNALRKLLAGCDVSDRELDALHRSIKHRLRASSASFRAEVHAVCLAVDGASALRRSAAAAIASLPHPVAGVFRIALESPPRFAVSVTARDRALALRQMEGLLQTWQRELASLGGSLVVVAAPHTVHS